ncbi:hypothetical protein [Thermodesulfovibrio thiophilus]|uniref:hypothetical protein n=1 Tax=Thermodesulfovibrio thiophilus TaxID=340095 RepID=UPI0003F6CCC8|nr:hypothetical protein [Thermodesulfovibrio thiophilus]
MKASLAEKIRQYLKKNKGATLQDICTSFRNSNAVKTIIRYHIKTGKIKEVGGILYYIGKENKTDRAWKAMKYLKRFKIKNVSQLTGWDRRAIGAVLTTFVRAGAVRKEIGKNRRDVYYVVVAEERPTLVGGKSNVSYKPENKKINAC